MGRGSYRMLVAVATLGASVAACNAILGIHGGTARPAVTQIAAGAAFACALLADGTVWCWGADDHQQLGHVGLDADVPCRSPALDGGTNVGLCSPTPTQVTGLQGVTQIAVGSDFACALLGSGDVDCWGANGSGQVGPIDAGDFTYPSCPTSFFEAGTAPVVRPCTPVPTRVRGLPPAQTLAAGAVHACASTAMGVYCWGQNASGVLDTPQAGEGPFLTADVPRASALAAPLADPPEAYSDNTCALLDTGKTICWGPNSAFEEGCTSEPCTLATTGVSALTVGDEHGCALGSSGSLDCWGDNSFLTINSTANPPTSAPTASDYVQVLRMTDHATIAAIDGRSTHTLALDTSGRLWAWGDDLMGELAISPDLASSCDLGHSTCIAIPTAVNLPDAGAVTAIATGVRFSLALTADGTVWTWGENTELQLGRTSAGGPCYVPEGGAVSCDPTPAPIQVPP